jgi:glycosyltransferase involved in cell wall biosynthesis
MRLYLRSGRPRKGKPMRILHATTSAGPGTLGIEKEVVLLAVAQQARGSDVMIAIDRQGVFTQSCLEHGIPVVVHDRLKYPLEKLVAMTPEEGAAIEDAVQGFIGQAEGFRPDIIHCHSGSTALVAITAGNRMNVPCAFTGDGVTAPIGGRKRGLRFATLCLTSGIYEDLLKSGLADTDVYYTPNGTRVVSSAEAAETDASQSVPSLIVAGILETRKGVDVLILAMVELRRRLGEACPAVNIYGDGARGKYLAEMAAALGLNDLVRFHGFKLGVLEQCPRTDVLVMPSRHEASPLVVLEAMSRGMPIVATDVGDVARMLPDPRYGRVVPPDSVIPLADAIESLLADIAGGRFDPDLPIQRHRSFYSIEKFAERTEAVYDQIRLNWSAAVHQAGVAPRR